MFRLEGVDGMVVPGNQYESSPQGLESFSAIVTTRGDRKRPRLPIHVRDQSSRVELIIASGLVLVSTKRQERELEPKVTDNLEDEFGLTVTGL